MLSRQDITTRKTALLDDLRRLQSEGHVPPGSAALSQRSLAKQYGLSVGLVGQLLATLINEGVLYSVPRLGTFVGKPPGEYDVYMLTFPYAPTAAEYLSPIQLGFEERVAQLGGASLRLTEAQAREDYREGNLPPLAGLFRMGPHTEGPNWWPEGLAQVEFGVPDGSDSASDTVRFDDVSGGRQAARHLLGMGHKKIAFLALHTSPHRSTDFFWSIERERGWAQAMDAVGLPRANLAFHPDSRFNREFSGPEQSELARQVAQRQLLCRPDITAIITANSIAAEGLLAALDEAGMSPPARPAILCFDDVASVARSVVSYLRLPWDEVGRMAAQLLWERRKGQLQGPAQQRLVQMRLIPRLTCRPGWPSLATTQPKAENTAGAGARACPTTELVGT